MCDYCTCAPAHVVDLEVPEEGVAVVADPVQELPDPEARLRRATLQIFFSLVLIIFSNFWDSLQIF